MKLSGEVKFTRPIEDIWEALHDTEILKNAIPGCQGLFLLENGEHEVQLKLGVAAVKGEYVGKVKLLDIEAPCHYLLIAEGSGKPGFVNAKMECKINPLDEESCQLVWDCEAEIGGKIAGVGNKVIGGIAKFFAGSFFKQINKQLQLN